MPKFRVTGQVCYVSEFDLAVEADTENEARELADEIAGDCSPDTDGARIYSLCELHEVTILTVIETTV